MVLLILSLDELRQEVRPVGLHQWRDLLRKYVHDVIEILNSGEFEVIASGIKFIAVLQMSCINSI